MEVKVKRVRTPREIGYRVEYLCARCGKKESTTLWGTSGHSRPSSDGMGLRGSVGISAEEELQEFRQELEERSGWCWECSQLPEAPYQAILAEREQRKREEEKEDAKSAVGFLLQPGNFRRKGMAYRWLLSFFEGQGDTEGVALTYLGYSFLRKAEGREEEGERLRQLGIEKFPKVVDFSLSQTLKCLEEKAKNL